MAGSPDVEGAVCRLRLGQFRTDGGDKAIAGIFGDDNVLVDWRGREAACVVEERVAGGGRDAGGAIGAAYAEMVLGGLASSVER